MRKPDFLVIGAPKAGTTTLWHLLNSHPDIFMASPKEPRFFSHDKQWAKGEQWYASLFTDAKPHQLTGEATPHYSLVGCFPETSQRIAHMLPDTKLIYSIRHPIRIIESAWKQLLYDGKSMPNRDSMPLTFGRAVREFPPLLEHVNYWSNLSAFRKYFPDNQILVLAFEEWTRNPEQALLRVWEFLGIDRPKELPNLATNESSGKRITRPSVQALRRLPMIDRIIRRTPGLLKSNAKVFTRIPMPARTPWESGTLEFVLNRALPEAGHILEYANYPSDFWNFPAEQTINAHASIK